jgi:glycoprotein 6-alpha-L-fucosyltransferase
LYEKDEYSRYYLPISETCTEVDPSGETEDPWPGSNDSRIIKSNKELKFRNEVPRIPYLFTAVPSDLLSRLEKAFEEPQAWWSSQLTKYLLRLKPDYQKIVDESMARMGFQHPIVGIHLRRGDKIAEVPYQPLKAYMHYANEYFDVLELTQTVNQRRIYMATDDPEVVREAKEKYPEYIILSDQDINQVAKDFKAANFSSLGIIVQSRILAQCDYYVFTMSSNLGRKIYEMFLWSHREDKEFVKSLDWRYFEDFEGHQYFNVVMRHRATEPKEYSADVGDVIDTYRHDQNGFMSVMKGRKILGKIPSFKLERIPNTAEFAKYDDVDDLVL